MPGRDPLSRNSLQQVWLDTIVPGHDVRLKNSVTQQWPRPRRRVSAEPAVRRLVPRPAATAAGRPLTENLRRKVSSGCRS